MQNLSLYANYIESLTKGPVAGGTAANAGEVFAPFRSKQKEIGAKYDAGSYGMNLALFTISQPMGLLNANNVFGIDGEQRNRGAEFTVYGAPVRGLRLLGGVTLLDAKQQRTAGGANDGKDVDRHARPAGQPRRRLGRARPARPEPERAPAAYRVAVRRRRQRAEVDHGTGSMPACVTSPASASRR